MSADQLKALFDTNATVLMFAFGIIWKFVPAFKTLANGWIAYINVGLYIIVHLLSAGDAHAGGFTLPATVGVLIPAFANSFWARSLWEGFGRHLVESLLKIKKPV